MRVEFMSPLKDAASIVVTYNDVELFTREFAAGETPQLKFDTPQESGQAAAILVIGEKRIPVGFARYYFDDVKGAQMLVEDAAALSKKHKNWQARTKLLGAIALFEKLSPDSEDLAKAYQDMAFVYFFARSRKQNVARRQLEALWWYEKSIAVYERMGDMQKLGGNLTNIGAMYGRIGDHETALARAVRGQQIEREHPTPADSPAYGERMHAWTHVAGHLLALDRIVEADEVVTEAIEMFADDPNAGHLWSLRARIYDRCAKLCREHAEATLPAERCEI